MKTTLTTIIILICFNISAQSRVHLQVGYKAFEIGYRYQNEEFLNFGISSSIAESTLLEKRANRNDTSKKIHEFKTDYVPAVFANIGATFDELTITGKLGGAYLDQYINGFQEKQKLYYAVGIRFDYKLSGNIALNASYDNINSAMMGLTLN